MKCPDCGTENSDDAKVCKKCGYNLEILKKYNNTHNKNKRISKIDSNTSFIGVILGFIIFGIFLFIGSFFFKNYLLNGSISFSTYLGLILITSLFFGSFTIGLNSCSTIEDVKNNGLSFLILSYFIIIGCIALSYTDESIISTTLSDSIGSVIDTSTLSSNQTAANNIANPLELLVFLILGLFIIFIGCYLGTFIGKLLSK